jgi:hypothetical protein
VERIPQDVLRGGFSAPSLAGGIFSNIPDNPCGKGTHERIMALIHKNATQSLNMTAADLLRDPSMRGRQLAPEVVAACIQDYWEEGAEGWGWRASLLAFDRAKEMNAESATRMRANYTGASYSPASLRASVAYVLQ